MLIKVGPNAFVVPSMVVGIVWEETDTGAMPLILLWGGHSVRAEEYRKRGATDEKKQEIILKLWQALTNIPS